MSGRRPSSLAIWGELTTCACALELQTRRHLRLHHHMTPARFAVLLALRNASSGLSMIILSRKLMVTAGNMTGLIRKLRAQGLVVPVSSSDRRMHPICLTEEGRRAATAVLRSHTKMLEHLLSKATHAQLAQLLTLLRLVRASLGT